MKAKPSKHSGEVILEVGRRDEPLMTGTSATPFRIMTILVPVDFSECSRKALQYAIPLAKQHGAEITLLYVSVPATYGTSPSEYGAVNYAVVANEMQEVSEEKLAEFGRKELGGETPSRTIVRLGSATTEIIEEAKSMPADLIVISTHGHSGLKHMLLGSVAEHVVRRAPCPVLVVREREHDILAEQ